MLHNMEVEMEDGVFVMGSHEGEYERLAGGNGLGKRVAAVVDWLCDRYALEHDSAAAAVVDALQDALDIPFITEGDER